MLELVLEQTSVILVQMLVSPSTLLVRAWVQAHVVRDLVTVLAPHTELWTSVDARVVLDLQESTESVKSEAAEAAETSLHPPRLQASG
jgi:hypothetical protein